jgi:hypothetical protein
MEILLILTVGALCIACFFIGAKVGQTVAKGKEIELPSIDPIKALKEREARKEAEAKQDTVNTILENIERYDGTARGQKDVPRG